MYERDTRFSDGFSLLIITLNKFSYNHIILFVSLKKIVVYIILAILLISLKNNFNQNLIKYIIHNLHALTQ